MANKILCLALLAAALLEISHAAPLISNEAEARKFVDKANEDLNACLDELEQTLRRIDDNNDVDKAFSALRQLAHVMAEVSNNTKAFDYSHFKDKELKYIFNILRKIAEEAIVGDDKFLLLITSIGLLNDLSIDKDIEGHLDKSLKLAYFPDIQNIIAQSNNSDELVYYWKAWREENEDWAKTNFGTTIDILKEAAKLTGEF